MVYIPISKTEQLRQNLPCSITGTSNWSSAPEIIMKMRESPSRVWGRVFVCSEIIYGTTLKGSVVIHQLIINMIMKAISQFFRQMLSGKDNKSIDISRVVLFEGVNAFIFLSFYAISKGGQFEPIAWGTGLAGILAAGGAAISMKANAEPEPTTPPNPTD